MKSLLFASLLAAASPLLLGQDTPAPNEKAERYHQLLLKRPDSGTLFDRFVDSWLDTGSKENLESFLQSSAKAGGAAEWRLLATYQDWMGREEQALQAMSTALEKSPDAGDLFFARAKMKARLLDFEGALADLEKGKAEAGEEAAILKGTWLARAGRPEDALTAWKEILSARPNDEELREDLIELQVGEGLYDEAIATGRELAAGTKDPYQRALRWMRLAAVEVMAGKRDEGLATYRKVLEMTGEDSWLEKEVLAQVDKVFRRDEDIMGQREFYAALREKFPQRVSLRKGLAAQMGANGEIEEAVALFREVLKITPGDVANREEFIALLENVSRYDLAVEELNVILRDNEAQPENWERMARLRDLMGDAKGLEEALEKVRTLRTTDGPGIVATAALFERYQMRDKAEEILRKGHHDFPESNEVTEALASFLASIDATEEEQSEATKMWLTMAEGADAEGLLRVSRALLAHRRAEACFQLLSERIAEFPENLLLLKQLCDAGLATDQAKEAFPHALQLAELAQSPTDLATALTEVTRLSRRLDLEPVIKDLEKAENKTAVQWCVIAELRELQGDLLASDQALAEAAKVGDAPLILSQKVRLLEARDELENAANVMREIVALPGGERPVYLRKLVGLLANAGKWQEALTEIDNWKRVAPGDKAAWLQRAELLNENGELEEAVDELRRALAKFGDEEELRSRLATALVEAGEYTEGERLYRKLYEEAEDSTAKTRWIERLAALAQQENRVEELLSEFERRKRRNSQEAGPLQALAAIHQTLGDYEMQREALAEAVRRKPSNVKLRHELAGVEERAGDIDRAMATLREAARLDSGPGSTQKLAEFYFRNGEIELGLDILRSQQNGNPREIEATALALMQNGEWETVSNYLAETVTNDWRLQFLNAMSTYQQGDKKEARTLLLTLCSVTEEIEGLTPLIGEDLFKGWREWLQRAGIQQDIRETTLMGAMQQFASTFFRMGSQRSSFNRSRTRSGQAQQTLPGTAEEMRYLALATLYLDATQHSVKDRDKLLALIPFPDSTFGDRLQNAHRLNEWAKEEFEAGRIGLAEMIRVAGSEEEFDIALLNRAANELKTSDPETADLALTLLLNRNPENSGELLMQKLELLKNVKGEERADRLDQIAILVLGNPSEQYDHYGEEVFVETSLKEREAVRAMLRQELAAWPVGKKMKAEEESLVNTEWFSTLLSDAWRNGRAAEFIDLANRMSEELLANLDPSRAGMVYYQGRYYPSSVFSGQQEKLFQPPTFPKAGAEIPHPIYQILRGRYQASDEEEESGGSDAFMAKWSAAHKEALEEGEQEEANNTEKEMVPEALKEEVPRLNSAQIRVLAWRWMGQEEELAKELKAFEESGDVDEILMTAGYYFQKEDFAKCYQLLSKARLLPMEKNERKVVDGQLALVGSILAQQETALDELEVARRAILRLRRVARSTEEEEQLVPPMTALGLSDVVAQMQAARLRKGLSSNKNTRRSASRGMTPRLSKALTEGNTDAAAREGLRLLRPYLRGSNNSWEIREMVERYRAANLIEPILALAHPGETRSYSRRMEYVALCEQLGKGELAKPILEALAKERPGDTKVTAKLVRYLPINEMMMEAKGLMTRETSDDFANLVGEICTSDTDDPFESDIEDAKSAERTLQAIDLTSRFLKTVEPSGDAELNLTWVVQVMIKAVEDWSIDGEIFSHLMAANEQKSDLEKRRQQSVRDLLQSGLRHPQVAAQAFSLMDGNREGLGWTKEELLAGALTSLAAVDLWEKNSTDPRLLYVRTNPWVFVSGQSYQDNEPESKGQMPAAFLASAIIRQNPEASKEQFAFLKKLDPDTAQVIAWVRVLAGGDETAAKAAIASWREQLDKDPQDRSKQYSNFLQLATLANVTKEKLAPLERDYFQMIRKSAFQSYDEYPQITELIRTRFERDGAEGVKAILESLLLETVGPRELWDEWSKLANQDRLGGQLESLAYSIQSVGEDILESPGNFETMRTILEFPPLLVNNDYEIGEGLTQILQCKSAAAAEKKLEDIGFWNLSWAELGAHVDWEKEYPLWASVLDVIVDYQLRDDLGKKLSQATGNRRFRQRLAGSQLTNNTNLFRNELEGVAGALMKLPESEQTGIANIFRVGFPNLTVPGAKPKSKELLAVLGQEKKEDILANARKRMAEGFNGAMYDYGQKQEIFREVCKLIPVDANFAAEYFAAAIKEPESARQNRFGQSVFFSGGRSQATRQDDIFNDLMDEAGDMDISLLLWSRFQDAFDRLPDGPLLSVGHANRYVLSDFINGFWNNQPKPENLKGVEAEIFTKYHWNDMPKFFASDSTAVRNTAIWLLWLSSSETWNVGDQAQKHWDWMEATNYAERHRIAANRNRTLTALRAWDKLKPEAHQTARETWNKVLADPEMTVRFRMEIACVGLTKEPRLSDTPEGVEAVTSLFESYVAENRSLHAYPIGGFLTGVSQLTTPLPRERWNKLLDQSSKAFLQLAASQRRSYDDDEKAEFAKALILLSLKLENHEATKATLSLAREPLRGHLDLMLDLVSSGQSALAKQLSTTPGLLYQMPSDHKWTPELAKNVEDLLPLIANEQERYRIHCLLASLPDGKEEVPIKQNDRLTALAKDFAAKAPKAPQARLQCLRAFMDKRDAIGILLPELEEISQRYLYTQAVEQDRMPGDISAANLQYILKHYFWEMARRGDFAPVDRHLKALATSLATEQNSYYTGRETATIQRDLLEGFLAGQVVNPDTPIPDEILQLTKDWYLAFSRVKADNDLVNTRAVALPFCLHAMAGKSKEFHDWIATLPKEDQAAYQQQLKRPERMASTWATGSWWRDEKNAEARKLFFRTVLADHFASKTLFRKHLSTWIVSRERALTMPEYWDFFSSMPENHPQAEQFRMEVGIALARNHPKERKRGLDILHKALKQMTAKGEANEHLCRAELAAVYGDKVKDFKTALELADQVDWQKVRKESATPIRKKMEGYRKNLKKNAHQEEQPAEATAK